MQNKQTTTENPNFECEVIKLPWSHIVKLYLPSCYLVCDTDIFFSHFVAQFSQSKTGLIVVPNLKKILDYSKKPVM